MKLTDGGSETFWTVFLGIQAVALLLWIKGSLWGWVVWRLWARKRNVLRTVLLLKRSGLPKPSLPIRGADEYLDEMKNDPARPVETRIAAAQAEMALTAGAASGIASAMRTQDAWNEAIVKWAGG